MDISRVDISFTDISSAHVSLTAISVKWFVVTSHVIDGDVTHRVTSHVFYDDVTRDTLQGDLLLENGDSLPESSRRRHRPTGSLQTRPPNTCDSFALAE